MAQVIMWLDPGGTTGGALWNPALKAFTSWQYDFRRTGDMLEVAARSWGSELCCGYEAYIITPGAHVRHDGSALRVIGMAEWLAYRHGVCMLPSQPPSARAIGLRHLKTIGWHRPGQVHANDASAHLLADGLRRDWLPHEFLAKIRSDVRGSSGASS